MPMGVPVAAPVLVGQGSTMQAASVGSLPAAGSVMMPEVVQGGSGMVYAAAPGGSMSAMPATMPVAAQPRYFHAAGSSEVPVYGTSVAVPALFQQQAAPMPTHFFQQDSNFSHEQLKSIFPLGAPDTFQPFSATQYQYNIVDSTSAFAAAGGMPAQSAYMTMPTASTIETPAPVATTAPSTMVENTVVTTETVAATSATKRKKKLNSKKKSKSCC